MAELLPQLRQSYEATGSAYAQKLNTYANIFRNIKKSQAAKQKFDEQLENQKELIQYRSDVQLNQQKQYYEDVTKPQQIAEAKRERLKQYQQKLEDSETETINQIQEFRKLKNKENTELIKEYGLDQFKFDIGVVEEGGQITGYKPEVYYGGEQVSASGYRDMITSLSQYAEKLKAVEDADEPLETFTDENGVIHLGNDEQGKRIISQVRTDDETRFNYYNMSANQRLKVSNRNPEGYETKSGSSGGSETPQSILNDVAPTYTELRDTLKDTPTLEVEFAENTVDDWGIGFFDQTETPKENIQFNGSIQDVQFQLNKAVGKLLPEEKAIDLNSFSPVQQKMIVSGQLDEQQLNQLSDKKKNIVQTMAGYSENTREELGRLFRINNMYENVYQNYLRTGDLKGRDQYYLDLWNAPANIKSEEDFKKLLKPIDEVDSLFNIQGVGKDYLTTDEFTQ